MSLAENYAKNGYFVVKNFVQSTPLDVLHKVVQRFYVHWKSANQERYQNGAVNASYLTNNEHLNIGDTTLLFHFIASSALQRVTKQVFATSPAFMNMQLFFNPLNSH